MKTLLGRPYRFMVAAASRLVAARLNALPGNTAYSIFFDKGFHLLPKSYEQPVPDETDLDEAFWTSSSQLVGVEMNEKHCLGLLDKVFPLYMAEFRESFPIHQLSPESSQFYLVNGSFMAIDAHVYYAFIRHVKPKRIVEIGAGNSTILAAAACERIRKETGQVTQLVAIDPFPNARLKGGIQGLSQLIEDKVQNVGMELFTSLEANDILFIDSSHVLRAGGDVQMEYCEILPRLASGVLVHIHDISLPKPYPRTYIDSHVYFNEQYLLQTFLCFNSRFEVIWPGNYMMLKYPDKVGAVFPEYQDMRASYPHSEPSSFWMRVKASR